MRARRLSANLRHRAVRPVRHQAAHPVRVVRLIQAVHPAQAARPVPEAQVRYVTGMEQIIRCASLQQAAGAGKTSKAVFHNQPVIHNS